MSTLSDVKKVIEKTIYDLDRRDVLVTKQSLKRELNDSEIYKTFRFKDDEEDIYLLKAIETYKSRKKKEENELKTKKSILKQKQNISFYKESIKNLQQKLDDKEDIINTISQEQATNRQFVQEQQKHLTQLVEKKEKMFKDNLIYQNNILEQERINLKGFNEALFLQKLLYTFLNQAKITQEGKVIVPTDSLGNSCCLYAFIYGIFEKAIQEVRIENNKTHTHWTKLLLNALREPSSAVMLFQKNINIEREQIITDEQKAKIDNEFLKLENSIENFKKNSIKDINSDVR